MSVAFGPERWAIEISKVLNLVLGLDHFPIDIAQVAREYSLQRFPEEPIALVRGETLPGFDGALYRAPAGKKGWGIFYNSAIQSTGRVNFTLAHELGHYLLHRIAYSDLLHWSDGSVCCSAADLLGMGNGMRFNFLTAVRRGMRSRRISFGSIANEWRPTGSISQFVNSHSRTRGGQTVEAYIKARWNGATNGPSPLSFFGVESTEDYDIDGYRLYSYCANAHPAHPGSVPTKSAEAAVPVVSGTHTARSLV